VSAYYCDSRPFPTWEEVLAECEKSERIFYKAPLDPIARCVRVERVFKNGKIRIDSMNHEVGFFTADRGHLGRFFAAVRHEPGF